MDVAIRVPAVRKFAVSTMVTLLLSGRLLVDSHVQDSMCDVLGAAAFIVGEFAEYLDEHLEVINAMLKPQVASLSFGVQNMFVHNVLKVYSSGLSQVPPQLIPLLFVI
jgi:AP-3 complex subunit delta-1